MAGQLAQRGVALCDAESDVAPRWATIAALGSVIEREPLGGAGQLKQALNGTRSLPEGKLMAVLARALVRLDERVQAA